MARKALATAKVARIMSSESEVEDKAGAISEVESKGAERLAEDRLGRT